MDQAFRLPMAGFVARSGTDNMFGQRGPEQAQRACERARAGAMHAQNKNDLPRPAISCLVVARRHCLLANALIVAMPIEKWWAREDSNLQPDRYERSALTIELRARCMRQGAATTPCKHGSI